MMAVPFATNAEKIDSTSLGGVSSKTDVTRLFNIFSFHRNQNAKNQTMVVIPTDSYRDAGLQNRAYSERLNEYMENLNVANSASIYPIYQIDAPLDDLYQATFVDYVQTNFMGNYFKQADLPEQIEAQLKGFQFVNKDKIALFLAADHELIEFINEANDKIREYFSKDITLTLELRSDPEGDFKEIFILINTEKDYSGAVKKLRKFDSEWFIKNLYRTKNKINIEIQ
jgi:hypothetical protein